tara:strand:+ start:2339 stop:2941 length:603 start_codon:yes stop_codon:yes gene_type:complete
MTATTELEAVNIMLASIGESPINSLTGTLPVDAKIAQNTLNEVNKEVQSEGWHFNTEVDVTLTRDASDNITLASNTLRVDPNLYDHPTVDAVQIGSKLYDRKNHKYEFDEDLKCVVVYFRTFTEITEPARRYVMIKAARIFVDRLVGDEGLRTFTQQDEVRARSILMETDYSNADHNILRGDPAMADVFATYSPSDVLLR